MFERIKNNFLFDDENVKVVAARQIKNLLNNQDNGLLNEYIRNLIYSGIGNILCDNLITQNKQFFTEILRCLFKISENEIFYTSRLATHAIGVIIQFVVFTAKNPNMKQSHMKYMAHFLASILARARSINISYVIRTKNIDHFLNLVEYLDVNHTDNPVQITSGSELLFVTIQYINDQPFNENLLIPLKELYQNCLKGLSKIIPQNLGEDSLPIFTSIKLALGISIEGLRLTENFEKVDSTDSDASNSSMATQVERSAFFKDMIQFTFEQVLDIVIPNFRKVDSSNLNPTEPLQYLAECLNLLFKCNHVDHQKLADELLIQKYLDYFMIRIERRQEATENKSSICKCVSYIVMHDANHCFDMNKWDDEITDFRIFINEGLVLFASDPEIKYDLSYFDALLFCAYSRYRFSSNVNIIEFFHKIPLTKRIATISVEKPPQILIIQVAWILFSILWTEINFTNLDVYLGDALTKLISLIKQLGIENCYVSQPAVLISVLRICIFPREIVYKAVKLSLGSNPPVTDIYELVGTDYKHAVIDALLNALSSGTRIVAERAFDELHKIIVKDKSLGHIVSSMWVDLPQILSSYNQDCEGNVEQYLKLLWESDLDELSIELAMECSAQFLTTFKREDIDVNGKIKFYILLLISDTFYLVSNDKDVILIFIDDKEFLNNVYSEIHKEGNDDLSVAALICLTSVLKAQIKQSVETQKILSIDLKELLSLLSRQPVVSEIALKFLNKVWISGIDKDSLISVNCKVEDASKILLGLYDGLWHFFGVSAPTEWAFIFTSLINFLNFCHQNCPEVLKSCCDHLGTFWTIDLTINRNYTQREFFNFMNFWLQCGLYSGSGYIQRAKESKRIRERGISHEKGTILSFERTLQKFRAYITSLIDSKNVEEEDVKKLMEIISTII